MLDFLMTSWLLKVSIMTQTGIIFCILLFHIFLKNVISFDKELAILYEFFDLRISKKNYFSRKKLQRDLKYFLKNFCLILYQNTYDFVQSRQVLCFKSIYKYSFGPTQIYPWKFSFSKKVISQSFWQRHHPVMWPGGSFLVC